ncbi:unnamed protein product [Cylicocyclus nassatus]|uniref:Uncharacterized protein n=1 Tax=Cylicocyclus nassatus TaxID=53992 RepID=A0AA36GMY8_CYLNA|nr:unnamed protein product [Cylicocyclus nassatus]
MEHLKQFHANVLRKQRCIAIRRRSKWSVQALSKAYNATFPGSSSALVHCVAGYMFTLLPKVESLCTGFKCNCWADYGNLARITAQNVKERVWEHAKKSMCVIVLDTNATAKARMFQSQQTRWIWLHVNWDYNEKATACCVYM